MTAWATSVIVFPEQPTARGGGSFTTMMPIGLRPVIPPLYAVYPWYSQSGVTTVTSGGGISIYSR